MKIVRGVRPTFHAGRSAGKGGIRDRQSGSTGETGIVLNARLFCIRGNKGE